MTPGASRKPDQLVFDLPHRQAQGAEDFLVSGSNEAAVELVDGWPGWSHPAYVVTGPEGSGKSHLTHVWSTKSGAPRIAATQLAEDAITAFERNAVLAVEDIDRGLHDERVLFHLLNLAREKRGAILLSSRALPGEIAIALPDLRSRLRAMPLVRIAPPDDALLKAVLVKLFADRQLTIEPNVIATLALHMDRSMAAAGRLVEEADRLALARRQKVTRALAAEALANLARDRETE